MRFIVLSLLLLFTLNMAYASSDEVKNSSIGVNMTIDNYKNRDYMLSLTHFIDEVHQLSFGYDKSVVQPDDAGASPGFSSKSFTLGLENVGDTFFNTGWELEKWGKPGDLKIQSVRVLAAANWEKVRVELRPQMQRIRFENVDTRIAALTTIDLSSVGAALNLTLMLNKAWFFDLRYFESRYQSTFQNVQSALENAACSIRYSTHISSAANSLAATLDDNRKLVQLSWQQGWGSVVADYQRAHGFISACDTDQGDVQVNVDIKDSWSVNFLVGSSISSISDRSNYMSTGVVFSF